MTNTDVIAEAILALINSKPRSPTKAEISDIIARAVAPARDKKHKVGAGQPDAEFNGEPVAWDPIEAEFPYTNTELTELVGPQIRLAFKLLGEDHHGARDIVRQFLDHGEDDVLLAMLSDWKTLARAFKAIASLIVVAQARAVVSFGAVAPDHPAHAQVKLIVDLDEQS